VLGQFGSLSVPKTLLPLRLGHAHGSRRRDRSAENRHLRLVGVHRRRQVNSTAMAAVRLRFRRGLGPPVGPCQVHGRPAPPRPSAASQDAHPEAARDDSGIDGRILYLSWLHLAGITVRDYRLCVTGPIFWRDCLLRARRYGLAAAIVIRYDVVYGRSIDSLVRV
jgi:hypothetical protein